MPMIANGNATNTTTTTRFVVRTTDHTPKLPGLGVRYTASVTTPINVALDPALPHGVMDLDLPLSSVSPKIPRKLWDASTLKVPDVLSDGGLVTVTMSGTWPNATAHIHADGVRPGLLLKQPLTLILKDASGETLTTLTVNAKQLKVDRTARDLAAAKGALANAEQALAKAQDDAKQAEAAKAKPAPLLFADFVAKEKLVKVTADVDARQAVLSARAQTLSAGLAASSADVFAEVLPTDVAPELEPIESQLLAANNQLVMANGDVAQLTSTIAELRAKAMTLVAANPQAQDRLLAAFEERTAPRDPSYRSLVAQQGIAMMTQAELTQQVAGAQARADHITDVAALQAANWLATARSLRDRDAAAVAQLSSTPSIETRDIDV